MNAFRNVLDILQLTDLGFLGPKFTWNNGMPQGFGRG